MLLHGQDFSHLFCQLSQPNRREIVDSKPNIIRVANWKKTTIVFPHFLFAELLGHPINSHIFCDFPKNYFQEHSMSWCGSILPQGDNLKNLPVDSMVTEQMTKELTQISNFIDFQLENVVVMIDEGSDEVLLIKIVNFTESLS